MTGRLNALRAIPPIHWQAAKLAPTQDPEESVLKDRGYRAPAPECALAGGPRAPPRAVDCGPEAEVRTRLPYATHLQPNAPRESTDRSGHLDRGGADMTRFLNADHLISWADPCSGASESSGKHRNTRRAPRSPLDPGGSQPRHAAQCAKDTYLCSICRRTGVWRGGKRRAIAVRRRIPEVAYYALRDGLAHEEPEVNYHDEERRDVVVRSAVKRLNISGTRSRLTSPNRRRSPSRRLPFEEVLLCITPLSTSRHTMRPWDCLIGRV
jgi:hypothetical protein